jgi:Fur family transcriptional regulator, zinc uptake regulator
MSTQALLKQAQKVCAQRDVRFTHLREQVFTLLANHQGAVGAYDLLDELKIIDPSAKPATIYRALDFLGKQGFVHKIESINAFLMCHHFGECNHPVQLLICDQCGYVKESQSDDLEASIQIMANSSDFKISHQIVEVHGCCASCQ